ncbi:oxidoreductase [Diaporthe helianthi]|uniref:Oxidoreductase n=1 Tax=Diaporthe helianthi TaxID=158607 RepID=A0A2P5I018_DIAHE|nr:oxidoreductase [Diaporthe helianthi]
MASIDRSLKPTRAILCMHGGGASAAIFRFQLATFRAALKDDFEFVYAEGPHIAVAGPDVLPFFAGMDPYYSWFRKGATDTEEEVTLFNKAVQKSVEKWTKTNPHAPIVGVLGFSQGGLASTVLLWEQQMGFVPWLPKLEFGVLICCAFSDVATTYMRAHSGEDEKMKIRAPTLHLHGRQDYNLGQARNTLVTHYSPQSTEVIEFEGEHHVPKTWIDIQKVSSAIRRIIANIS